MRAVLICDLAALPQLRTELEQLHEEQQQPQHQRRPRKRRRDEQAEPEEIEDKPQSQRITRSESKRSGHSVRNISEPLSPARPLSQEESQEWEPSESSPSPAKRRRRSSDASGIKGGRSPDSPTEASPSDEPSTAIGSNHAMPHSMQNGSGAAPQKPGDASQAGPPKDARAHFLDCPVCGKQVCILLSRLPPANAIFASFCTLLMAGRSALNAWTYLNLGVAWRERRCRSHVKVVRKVVSSGQGSRPLAITYPVQPSPQSQYLSDLHAHTPPCCLGCLSRIREFNSRPTHIEELSHLHS